MSAVAFVGWTPFGYGELIVSGWEPHGVAAVQCVVGEGSGCAFCDEVDP